MRRASLAALLATVAVLASACGSASPDEGTPQLPDGTSAVTASPVPGGGDDPPESPTLGTGAAGDTAGDARGGTGDPEEGEGQDGRPPEQGASEDDLLTFAYATTDEATLAAEVTALGETVLALEADLQARDLEAAEADARTLLEQAETLEAGARAAEDRQRPLEPEDADLVDARRHALDAFGSTADYAASVTAVADAVLDGRLADLPALLQDAADLAGTGDEVAQAYADLNAELVAWAEAHPTEAARALATYGTE